MKTLAIIVVLLCTTSLFAEGNNDPVRIDQLFNFGWKFKTGEVPDAENPKLDDSDWRKLDLPHDFQFEQPWDKTASRGRGFKAMGTGWYRKHFDAAASWKGKRILLDFEGIMLTGSVWVNGQKIGGTDYGYLGFEADITDLIKYDTANVVVVRASTGEPGNSRWYTGGGLFRDVHLVVHENISISRHGVFITTPRITDRDADINVQVEVAGIMNQQVELEIKAKIYSPDGKLVAETTKPAPKKSKLAEVEVSLPKSTISNPQLWSCETPHLYSADVALILNGKVIDRRTENLDYGPLSFPRSTD